MRCINSLWRRRRILRDNLGASADTGARSKPSRLQKWAHDGHFRGPVTVNLQDLPVPPTGRTGWPWTAPEPDLAPPPCATGGLRMSIVTPSFNQGQYLEETIRSVLLQGYSNLEYFVIDGGSTDSSVDIIRRYERWLTGWVSEPDRGQSHAINKGFARATGEILGWLNSDDIYLLGALSAVADEWGRQPQASLIYGQAAYMDHDSVLSGEVLSLPYDYQRLLRETNFIPQPSAFFRARDFAALGGLDEALHFCMDYDLWLRLHDRGQAIYLARPLTGMRTYPESKTGSADRRMFVEVRQMIDRHGGRGLPAGFEQWLLQSRLPKAFEAFRRGDPAAGSDELAYVVENVPAWQAKSSALVNEIVGRAWEQAPGLADADEPVLAFANLICRNLPKNVLNSVAVRRQVLARIQERLSVRRYQRGEFGAARHYVWQVLRHDARRATRRGLWGAYARSWFQPTVHSSEANSRLLGENFQRQILAQLAHWARPDDGREPTLLDACALSSSISLLNGWDTIEPGLRYRFAALIQAAQNPATGLFVPEGIQEAALASRTDSDPAAWLPSLLAVGGLAGLGVNPAHPLKFVDSYATSQACAAWLEQLNWSTREWSRSLDWSDPAVENGARLRLLLSFLIHESQQNPSAGIDAAVNTIFDWLDERQDPISGLWGLNRGRRFSVPSTMAGFFAPSYFEFGRPLRNAERLIDTLVGMQHGHGLFSPPAEPAACAALTVVEALVRLSRVTEHRASTVKAALAYAFRPLVAGLKAALSAADIGFWPGPAASTWIRTSSLAMIWLNLQAVALISQRSPESFLPGAHWQFPLSSPPGAQIAPPSLATSRER